MSLGGFINHFSAAAPLLALLWVWGGVAYGQVQLKSMQKQCLSSRDEKPTLVEQPQDCRVQVGKDATFTVKAQGSQLKYQWLINGKPHKAARKATVRMTRCGMKNNGTRFQAVVSNREGKIETREAILTVYIPGEGPSIDSFAATPDEIEKGQKVSLLGTFSGGTGVVEPGHHQVATGKALVLYPTETTTFTLHVTSFDEKTSVKESVQVRVKAGNTPPSPTPPTPPTPPAPTPNDPEDPTPDPTPSGNLLSVRCRHTATLLKNGKVLMVGGQNTLENRKALNDVEIFDPTTNKSLALRKLKTARTGHTATLLRSGHVFLAGGLDKDEAFSSVWEIYDPLGAKVVTHGEMDVARAYHTATLMTDGKVLLLGGSNNTPVVAELFDPEKNTTTKLAKAHHIHCQHTATLLKDGKILIAGSSDRKHEALAYGEIYDPVANTFASVGDLATGRFNHTATLLTDGKVLVTGGYTGTEELNSAEVYDPAKKSFTPLSNGMQAKRSGHTAILLPSGNVFLAGATAKAELFDPAQGTFTSDCNVTPRRFHTATLLQSGRVLLAAGQKGTTLLDSVEYYGAATAPDDVEDPPVITTHPASKTVMVGGSVTLSVVAEGKHLRYKWFKNNASIHGATSDSYTIEAATQEQNGAVFAVEVSNRGGSLMSNGATLTVTPNNKMPIIDCFVATPTSVTAGQEVKLSAHFSNGTGVITPGDLAVNSDVPLIVKPTATTAYTLKVTNNDGFATATVTVTVAGGDGQGNGAGGFASSGNMKVERVGHTATLLPTGKVLMVGGTRTNDLSTILALTELYDPATGQFTATGNLAQGRRGHTATLLTNGKVLIAGGGSNAVEPFATAEVYDASTGTFSKVGNNMSVGRNNHTATTLADGKVLIVGGGTGGGVIRSQNQCVYHPCRPCKQTF